jgi:hypothetical protein
MLSIEEINHFILGVKEAFGNLAYPGDEHIVSSAELKSNYDEAMKILNFFRGKRWQDITLDALIANRDHLPVFTPEAYCYYLPAYMIATISQFANVDVLSNNTLYSLTPPEQDDAWKEIFLSTAKEFTQIQRLAISNFLELYSRLSPDMLKYDPNRHLQKAIEFWKQEGDI